jgi:hypothetical protein
MAIITAAKAASNRILKVRSRPLHVRVPPKFELAIDLKTAKAIRL